MVCRVHQGHHDTKTLLCCVVFRVSFCVGSCERTKAAQQEDGEDHSQDDGDGVAARAAVGVGPLCTLSGSVAR